MKKTITHAWSFIGDHRKNISTILKKEGFRKGFWSRGYHIPNRDFTVQVRLEQSIPINAEFQRYGYYPKAMQTNVMLTVPENEVGLYMQSVARDLLDRYNMVYETGHIYTSEPLSEELRERLEAHRSGG